jgi:hypothetical protein
MRLIKLLLMLLVSSTLVACNSEITLSMNDNVPPTFSFSGDFSHVNYLDFFIVKEVATENLNVPYTEQNPQKNIVIWQIWPKGTSEGTLKELPPITYGVVPDGFTQKVPEKGHPPALIEGKVYEAGGPPVILRKGFIRFTIRDGKAINIPIVGRE